MGPKMIHFILLDAPFLHPFRQVFSTINVVMHFGQLLAPFGSLLSPFCSLLAAFGHLLAPIWCHLVHVFWEHFGYSFGDLFLRSTFGCILVALWTFLGSLLAPFETIWCTFALPVGSVSLFWNAFPYSRTHK